MASTPTQLDAPTITLTPPDPVPVVAPAQAAGLVPLSNEQTSKLDQKVDAFVADLVAQDAASPEFGKRVDQLTSMGRKEIAAAAGLSNRFLDRPSAPWTRTAAWAPICWRCARRWKSSIPASRASWASRASCWGSSLSAAA
jgi:hypothetical protein